jgi:hypothetical protein
MLYSGWGDEKDSGRRKVTRYRVRRAEMNQTSRAAEATEDIRISVDAGAAGELGRLNQFAFRFCVVGGSRQ